MSSVSVLFGLTADPIHKGHEQVIINGIEYCRERGFEIEQFLLIPVYQPNLITDKKPPIANFTQRVAMCELVAKRLSKQLRCHIQVSKIEKSLTLSTGKNNYSVNTIKAFNKSRPEVSACVGMKGSLLFMVSADHFTGRWPKFRKWYKWQELLKYSGLLINQRPDNKINFKFVKKLKDYNPHIYLVKNKLSKNVSSSQIRAGVVNDKNLSRDVLEYIHNQKLYMPEVT